MKIITKLILCSLLGSVLYAGLDIRDIRQAIQNGNMEGVISFLKGRRTHELSSEEQSHLYGTLYDVAAQVVDKKSDEIGFFGSIIDVGQALTGSLMAITAASMAGYAYFKKPSGDMTLWSDEDKLQSMRCKKLYIGGAGMGVLGIFLAYSGFTCSAQRGNIQPARDIEKYFEKLYRESLKKDDGAVEQMSE